MSNVFPFSYSFVNYENLVFHLLYTLYHCVKLHVLLTINYVGGYVGGREKTSDALCFFILRSSLRVLATTLSSSSPTYRDRPIGRHPTLSSDTSLELITVYRTLTTSDKMLHSELRTLTNPHLFHVTQNRSFMEYLKPSILKSYLIFITHIVFSDLVNICNHSPKFQTFTFTSVSYTFIY